MLILNHIKLKIQHQFGYNKCFGLGETPVKAKNTWVEMPFTPLLICGILNLTNLHLIFSP